MSLGGARQLLDFLSFALLHNAITQHHTRQAANPVTSKHLRVLEAA